MIKNTDKLEKHILKNPTDAQSVISLLKTKSKNYMYDYDLQAKRKKEKLKSIRRKNKDSV